MEENMSEDDDVKNNEVSELNNIGPTENPKRLKKDDSGVSMEKSEKANGDDVNSRPGGTDSAGTSTSDTVFSKAKNTKTRNYRHRNRDDGSSSEEQVSTEEPTPTTDEPTPPRVEAAVQVEDLPPGGMDGDVTTDASNAGSEIDSAASTVINDTESESELEEPLVLKKEKPKHNWFVVPEVQSRQLGHSARYSSELFQRRCYGSLHCVQRLELMSKLEYHDGCVNSLNFHPNGRLLASGSDDLKVGIWDWKIGKLLLAFDTKHRGNVFQSKFLPLSGDELNVATCARDGQVRLAQISSEGRRSSRRLGTHKGPCHKLSVLDSQPQVILSCGEDGYILCHDLRNHKSEKVIQVTGIEDHKVALYSISSNPTNNYEFCVGGRDYIVRSYDQRKCSENGIPLHVYYPNRLNLGSDSNGLHVTCAIYNYNGNEILASYNDDDIYIFDKDAKVGNFSHRYQGHRNGATIKGVNFFGPKSEYIVSGSDCGNVYFWDRHTEAIVQWMLADDNGVVNCLEPHPQLPFICTSGLDWDVKLWVPSCEHPPAMTGLSNTVKRNNRSRFSVWRNDNPSGMESQILWMLWRHLRTSERLHRSVNEISSDEERRDAADALILTPEVSSSSSSSSSDFQPDLDDDEEEDDDEDVEPGAINCSPS